jgi:hypothetical protein
MSRIDTPKAVLLWMITTFSPHHKIENYKMLDGIQNSLAFFLP